MHNKRQQQILEFIEQARNIINFELRHPAARKDEYNGIWADDAMSSAGPIESLHYIDHILQTVAEMIDYEDEQMIDKKPEIS